MVGNGFPYALGLNCAYVGITFGGTEVVIALARLILDKRNPLDGVNIIALNGVS